jgi:hypothetical protein
MNLPPNGFQLLPVNPIRHSSPEQRPGEALVSCQSVVNIPEEKVAKVGEHRTLTPRNPPALNLPYCDVMGHGVILLSTAAGILKLVILLGPTFRGANCSLLAAFDLLRSIGAGHF